MNHPRQFLDHIVAQFLLRMHQWPANNYDAVRFSFDGTDRSMQFNIEQHKDYLLFLLDNYEPLYQSYLLLEDERSRKTLVDLLLFRLAGHLHVKLDANNPRHWSLRDQAWKVPSKPSVIRQPGVFGPLEHFDDVEFAGRRLSVDCWRVNLAWTFFIKQYFFERDGLSIGPRLHDHVVDAGACFGDTALAFAAAVCPNGRVYAFEPLANHLEIIRYNVAQNPALADAVRTMGYGLGDVSRRAAPPIPASVLSPGFALSAIPDQERVPVETLDNLVGEGEIQRVDFVKMDVEGCELRALRGAETTLRRFRPRLAISVYHRPQDMFEIPAFIHGLGLGYRFYLEHYTIHAEETVLYAMV